MTHDNEVGEACDRIVRMRDGLIREPAMAVAPIEPRMVDRRDLVAAGTR